MLWKGRQQSQNVEDLRGRRMRTGVIGGGIGTVALVLIAMYLGVDPNVVMQGVGTVDNVGPTTDEPYVETAEEALWREQVSVTLADTEDAWGAIFQEKGGQYREPKLVMFTGAVQSGCGGAEAAMGPFYCPADSKVYIDLSFFTQLERQLGAGGDFARSYVIAHEVGHHVQNLLGTSTRVHDTQQRVGEVEANQLSVRLELQADCYAGLWARRIDNMAQVLESGDAEEAFEAARAIGDDTLQRNAGQAVVPDSFTHGTSPQRMRWFRRGFDTGALDDCDTFAAADL